MATILIIDDNAHIRQMTAKMLQFEGYETLEAEHGQIGLQLAQTARPDLIVSDIVMPEMSGYAVLIELRRDPKTADIPFIFLTAKASMDELRKGMEFGADDYLTKPFEIDELLSAINTRLERHRLMREQMHQLQYSLTHSLPHELRTPLHGIISLAEFLESFGVNLLRENNTQEFFQVCKYIRQDAVRLQRLVENALLHVELQQLRDTARQSASSWAQRDEIAPKAPLAFLARQITERAERTADLRLDLDDIRLWMNERSLQKIVEELLDNACKFSEPGTPISLSTRIEGEQAVFSVSDHGRGMTPEHIASISAFMQFDRQRAEQQGLGLGLAIASRLTRLHHGALEIQSEPGRGATVRVSFPPGNTR